MIGGPILVLNAGSSSLKFATFDRQSMARVHHGQIAQIGQDATLVFGGDRLATSARDHGAALRVVLAKLGALSGPPSAVGHRVVHGGEQNQPAILTPHIFDVIENAATMAPLHNPAAVAVMKALDPSLPQVVCFDTAFHANNPIEATTIAIPEQYRANGIKRYGFHGLSYAGIVRRFTKIIGHPLPRRLLAMHLGAGASMAAVKNGTGVATTMGFSPLDGLVMATRAGSIDPGVLLHLMRSNGLDIDEIDRLLNHQSGLTALAGTGDMKTLLAAKTPDARFALDHYCYWINRHAGSMIAAMNGLDGVVFTGGIAENAPEIRSRVMEALNWMGSVPHWIIPADEEAEIALHVKLLL